MVIQKYKSYECKGDQQWQMVCACIDHWYRLNTVNYPIYSYMMNMFDFRINEEHDCLVALIYYFKLNKW